MKHNITDQLKLYRGSPHKVNENIVIHMPTLGDICDYGEAEYYRMVYNLCSTGIDLCWQLDEIGVNFDEITDYELFVKYLCRGYDTEQTRILFGDRINFKKMLPFEEKDGSIILMQLDVVSVFLRRESTPKSEIICNVPVGSIIHESTRINEGYYKVNYCGNIGYISSKFIDNKDQSFYVNDPGYLQYSDDAKYEILTIDERTYYEIVTYLRAMHNLQRDNRIAGSRSCRAAFIEDAKMEYDAKKMNRINQYCYQ